MSEYVIEPIEDINIKSRYVVKTDGWFYLTNTKIEAEFLAERLNKLQKEINILKKEDDEIVE